MIWTLSAIGLGLGLGVLGFYFSKMAYSAFAGSMALFVFLSSYVTQVSPDMVSKDSSLTIPISETGSISEGGSVNLLFRFVDNMGLLPPHIQLALILFVVSFFVARIGTWLYTRLSVKAEKVESNADRRQRILAQYGMKDIPR